MSRVSNRRSRGSPLVPTSLFFLLVAILTLSLTLSDRPPVIEEIAPSIGLPGGMLILKGRHFGDARDGATVSIAGVRPNSNTYSEWSDTRVAVKIPAEVETGVVLLSTRSGESNPVLFTNRESIPVLASERRAPGVPHIESVDPSNEVIGGIITISGLSFGPARGVGAVLFSAIAPVDVSETVDRFIEASPLDFDYESWSEQAVRVRVPDGATSGIVRVLNDRGESNGVFFEVKTIGGGKTVRSRKGYQIVSAVEIDGIVAASGAQIELRVPGPVGSPSQRGIESEFSPQPDRRDDRGVSHYSLFEVGEIESQRIESTHWLDRYAIETRIDAWRIIEKYDEERRLFRHYTMPDELIPSDDERIVAAAQSAVAGVSNPMAAALSIYRSLLNRLEYDRKSPAKDVVAALDESRADALDYSLLLCAMLRSARIPARPVAGLLVYEGNRTIEHVWAEFYVEGFGWVPVDPALGDGVEFGTSAREDAREYYFGNLDANRITLSRGIGEQSDPAEAERAVRREGMPSLQRFHELPGEGVESYRATWSRIDIIDVW